MSHSSKMYSGSPIGQAKKELSHRAEMACRLLRADGKLDPFDMLAAVVWGRGAPRVPRKKAA